MSFLDRSVPLKYAILAAVAVAVFATTFVHGLQSRSNSIARYGPALPAEVVKIGESKTAGSIFGLGGTTYTKAEVKVTPRSGEPWYYGNVPLGGRPIVGEGLKAWFYDGNSNNAYFSNWFNTGSEETEGTPWLAVEDELFFALVWTLLASVVTYLVLRILSPRKKRRAKDPNQESTVSEGSAIFDGSKYV
jgi:hypothetical protein